MNALDVDTGELIALPKATDPLAAELLRAVDAALAVPAGGHRDARLRYAYGVRNRVWEERERLYRQTEDKTVPVVWDGFVVAYQPASEEGVLVDQWRYLQAHPDAPQADDWLMTLHANWRRYGALCDALEATRGIL